MFVSFPPFSSSLVTRVPIYLLMKKMHESMGVYPSLSQAGLALLQLSPGKSRHGVKSG